MASLFKWLIGLTLALVLLLGAAVVILMTVVDPNDYKPQIVEAAQKQLGRELVIEQDIQLSVFPWLGLDIGGVRLGNAPGFEAEWFAEVERLGVKAKLLPLLSKQIEVDTLILRGLRLNLEKNAQGKTNWEDLAGAADAPATEQEAPAASDSAPALQVQGIQIEDARIVWDDRQAGQQYTLDGVRLVTGSLTPGAEVPIEAAVSFTSEQPAMRLDAKLDATLSSDPELKVFEVAGLVLQLDASGEGLPEGGAELRLETDLVADTAADTLVLKPLAVSGPALSASGQVAVKGLQTDPAATGELRIAETNLKTLAAMFASPIETTDPQALTRAGGELGFSFAKGALRIEPLELRLDDSTLKGHLHLLDSQGPVVRTTLTLDEIDLDRYLPPAAEQADAAPAGEGSSPSKPSTGAADPFAALRTLDLVGEFTINKLKVAKLRMNEVRSKLVARNGVLKVDPMKAGLYQGNLAGRLVLDTAGKRPKLALKESLTEIQIGPLLDDLTGQGRLTGRGEVHVDIRATGLSEPEVRRTLNGSSRFVFRDGAVKGVNIAQLIRDASSRLGLSNEQIEIGTPRQTDFSELGGSMTITNGVIRNDDLQAKSPLLRVSGKGQVDLPKDTIDYRVLTELVGSLQGQGAADSDGLAGVPIPIRVRGPLTDPSFRPDLEGAVKARAQAEIDKQKQKLQEKAQDAVKDKLDGALKGLFN